MMLGQTEQSRESGAIPKLKSLKVSADQSSIQILRAAFAALPTLPEMDQLLVDGKAAEERGYFNPVEDERLREAYARYLGIRSALWGIIKDNEAASRRVQTSPDKASILDRKDFSIAFCAAEIIVRTGEYLIDLAHERKIIWRKLDEAEIRYGLKRKSFTRLYRQLTSAYKMYGFYRACDIFDQYQDSIIAAAPREILGILDKLNLPTASRGDHLRRYSRFVRHSLKRRKGSASRNVVFSIFEMMGSDIADLKIPFVKPPQAKKRVTDAVRAEIKALLKPGDIFVTRHDDAMSNLFLPGFWPHAALWLGDEEADFLEAKKDGVLLRQMEETLQVDAFVVLRPKLTSAELEGALSVVRSHAGKLYDFIFDFSTADRLVCTEVVYRCYHGVGPIDFKLGQQAGRYCLSAEDLLNQGIENGFFDVIAIYGIQGDRLSFGNIAKDILKESYAAKFLAI